MEEADERNQDRGSEPNKRGVTLVYRRPYEDQWGALHDPTTTWDETLKYYHHGIVLQVSQACRRMAQPADVGAARLIRRAAARHRRNLKRAYQLEARYLRTHHRRRSRKTHTSRAASRQRASATARPK